MSSKPKLDENTESQPQLAFTTPASSDSSVSLSKVALLCKQKLDRLFTLVQSNPSLARTAARQISCLLLQHLSDNCNNSPSTLDEHDMDMLWKYLCNKLSTFAGNDASPAVLPTESRIAVATILEMTRNVLFLPRFLQENSQNADDLNQKHQFHLTSLIDSFDVQESLGKSFLSMKEDFCVNIDEKKLKSPSALKQSLPKEDNSSFSSMSPRERALARRQSRLTSTSSSSRGSVLIDHTSTLVSIPTMTLTIADLIKLLIEALTSPKWQLRHVSSLMLSALFSNETCNNSTFSSNFYPSLATQCLEVLTRERFTDFAFNNTVHNEIGGIVCPVRESTAQLFANLLISSHEQTITALDSLVKKLIIRNVTWEVKHAALLVIKHVINKSKIALSLPIIQNIVKHCLSSMVDEDVQLQALLILKSTRSNDSTIKDHLLNLLQNGDSHDTENVDDMMDDRVGLIHALAVEALLDDRDLLPSSNTTLLISYMIPLSWHHASTVRRLTRHCLVKLLKSRSLECDHLKLMMLKALVQQVLLFSPYEEAAEKDVDEQHGSTPWTRYLNKEYSIVEHVSPVIKLDHTEALQTLLAIVKTPPHSSYPRHLFMLGDKDKADFDFLSLHHVSSAHILGFKEVDRMSQASEERLLRARYVACQLIQRLSHGFKYPKDDHSSPITKSLTTDTWFERIIELWCGVEANAFALVEHGNKTTDLWEKRWLCLTCNLDNLQNRFQIAMDVLHHDSVILFRELAAEHLCKVIKSNCDEVTITKICKMALPSLHFIHEVSKNEELLSILIKIILKQDKNDPITDIKFIESAKHVAQMASDRMMAKIPWQELLKRLLSLVNDISSDTWAEAVATILVNNATDQSESTNLINLFLETVNDTFESVNSRVNTKIALVTCIHTITSKVLLKQQQANDDSINLALVSCVMMRPLLGRLSDADHEVRIKTRQAFNALLQSISLLDEKAEGDEMQGTFAKQLVNDSIRFLKCLNNPGECPPCPCPESIQNATLRSYQQAGLNWLCFLKDSGLHGALCDDMGLGKTLQTLCIISVAHEEKRKKVEQKIMVSLVVCPASLLGHWQQETKKYCRDIKPLTWNTSKLPSELAKKPTNSCQLGFLLITSYEHVRSTINQLNTLAFEYIVLDEGHLIRNPQTQTAQALKSLISRSLHRLILTGTPLQNNVLELWSLFDWLMPGYLGEQRTEFVEKYAKAIMTAQLDPSIILSNITKGSSSQSLKKLTEAERKLSILHRTLLPFILRRMKEQVLTELPPKLIQDYKVPMTSLQRAILKGIEQKVEKDRTISALERMSLARKLCTHPLLVTPFSDILSDTTLLDALKEDFKSLMEQDTIKSTSLIYKDEDFCARMLMSPKLNLIRDLLWEECLPGGHRVLIFAQSKATLDLLERHVLSTKQDESVHQGVISYLRIDGEVKPSDRQQLVHDFNTCQEKYPVMLLTTQCGSLGLNLSSADTVIFVELDWNPQRDLQAMDRAHRIGQKSTVRIYRIIVEESIEERILGMQRWKVKQANIVVKGKKAHENTMNDESDTDEQDQQMTLLELLGRTESSEKEATINGDDQDQDVKLLIKEVDKSKRAKM